MIAAEVCKNLQKIVAFTGRHGGRPTLMAIVALLAPQ